MNRQEAMDVLETIKLLYPKYELTLEKGRILIPLLERMEYGLVMENLTNYVARSLFHQRLRILLPTLLRKIRIKNK
ncbi:hypothetical protein [Paucisalibacillus sp. EB02]|uniref:hypothetical protein n=1 Tax=Paucisalibacillus sp. EB02 TaxID=1347087 RepID=UPI0005A79D17|nr:hypothetical protein [Paucisalibacillus sp. EB02]